MSAAPLQHAVHLPLRWWNLERLPDGDGLAALQSANAEVLRAVNLFDTLHHEGADDPGGTHAGELVRVEQKLNLMLEMLGRLVARGTDRPDARPVWLSAEGASWEPDAEPVGADVRLAIWLASSWPDPLVFCGPVTPVEGAPGRVQVAFTEPGDAVVDGLEKYIFRAQRRQRARRI